MRNSREPYAKVGSIVPTSTYPVHRTQSIYNQNLNTPRDGREGSGGGRGTDLVLPKARTYQHEVGASFREPHRARLAYPTARTRDERHPPLDVNLRVCVRVCGGGGG